MRTSARLLQTVALGLTLTAMAFATEAAVRISLSGGFHPDPTTVELDVTGAEAASTWVRGCPGFVPAEAPLVVGFQGGNTPLRFYLAGEGLAGLVLEGPDGVVRCEPLGQAGFALIRIEQPIDGDYRLLPAAVMEGARASGRLLVTELELSAWDIVPPEPPSAESLAVARLGTVAIDPAPEGGRQILGRGPLVANVEAASIQAGCSGHVDASASDVIAVLDEALPSFSLYVESASDTVLLVLDPAGNWQCNDDSFGSNPALTWSPAPAGSYHLLVGTYSSFAQGEATVLASPGEPRWAVAEGLDRDAEPAAGRHMLPEMGALELPLFLAGGASASDAGPGCSGQIDTSRPDVVLSLGQPEPTLFLHATSAEDTTLVVIDPQGNLFCDDDSRGFDPAVRIGGAGPGDYAIWVGVFSGGGGGAATLIADREVPDWYQGGWTGGFFDDDDMAGDNPFAGRELESAAHALRILIEEEDLGEVLSFERLDETGTDGFVLHGVVLRDPMDDAESVRIARFEVSRLDLVGLSEFGAPSHFSVAAEGIDYGGLAEGARNYGLLPLPQLDQPTTMSIATSLLPAEAGRMTGRFMVRLDGQFGFALEARVRPPEDDMPMALAFEDMLGEALEVELQDLGFLGVFLREQAAEEGRSVEAMVAEALAELAELLEPMTPGGARAQLYAAISAMLTDLDHPGVLRLRLESDSPQGLDSLFEQLMGDALETGELRYAVSYERLP